VGYFSKLLAAKAWLWRLWGVFLEHLRDTNFGYFSHDGGDFSYFSSKTRGNSGISQSALKLSDRRSFFAGLAS